jgi:hypothetical protein
MQNRDPIGVRGIPYAGDEYDNYVGDVHVMLMEENATFEEIADYLWNIATDYMGNAPTSTLENRCKLTAEKLVELRPHFQIN